MKVKYVSIFTIVLVLVSGLPLIASPGAMNYAIARYATNTQTQSNANECDSTSNCAINSPQTQGDGTANSPTNLQISKFNEQEQIEEEPPTFPPLDPRAILVVKEVICPEGFECPTADKSIMSVALVSPSLTPSGQDILLDTFIFRGSEIGTFIPVPNSLFGVALDYKATELIVPPTPPGLDLVLSPDGGCQSGVVLVNTCTITNEYRVAPTTP